MIHDFTNIESEDGTGGILLPNDNPNNIKCYQFSNNISISNDIWKDIDYHWKVNQIKLPGFVNWIRRLIKRGGYRYEDYYDKDAVNPIAMWAQSIGGV